MSDKFIMGNPEEIYESAYLSSILRESKAFDSFSDFESYKAKIPSIYEKYEPESGAKPVPYYIYYLRIYRKSGQPKVMEHYYLKYEYPVQLTQIKEHIQKLSDSITAGGSGAPRPIQYGYAEVTFINICHVVIHVFGDNQYSIAPRTEFRDPIRFLASKDGITFPVNKSFGDGQDFFLNDSSTCTAFANYMISCTSPAPNRWIDEFSYIINVWERPMIGIGGIDMIDPSGQNQGPPS